MIGRKTAVYRNELGQEVVMDNRTIFLEYIDMTGVSGRHIREALAGTNGQTTVESFLDAKVIPCSLAFYDRTRTAGGDYITSELLGQIFSPELRGVLTVYTRTGRKYSIDVRPQNNPTFKRDAKRVWRTDIEFFADFPYWRLGEEKSITLTQAGYTSFTSNCVHNIPVRILFPVGYSGPFRINDYGFNVNLAMNKVERDFPLWVDTLSCTVKDENGEQKNQWIGIAAPLNMMYLRFGDNKLFTADADPAPIVYYNKLSLGEV